MEIGLLVLLVAALVLGRLYALQLPELVAHWRQRVLNKAGFTEEKQIADAQLSEEPEAPKQVQEMVPRRGAPSKRTLRLLHKWLLPKGYWLPWRRRFVLPVMGLGTLGAALLGLGWGLPGGILLTASLSALLSPLVLAIRKSESPLSSLNSLAEDGRYKALALLKQQPTEGHRQLILALLAQPDLPKDVRAALLNVLLVYDTGGHRLKLASWLVAYLPKAAEDDLGALLDLNHDLELGQDETLLVRALQSPNADLRSRALELSRLPEAERSRLLLGALADPDWAVARKAFHLLRQESELGGYHWLAQAEELLPQLALARKAGVQEQVASLQQQLALVLEALLEYDLPQALNLSAPLLDDPNSLLRTLAVRAVVRQRAKQHLPKLVAMLQRSNTYVEEQVMLIRAVGAFKDKAHMPMIAPYLGHPVPEVRRAAILAMNRYGQAATPLLLELLDAERSTLLPGTIEVVRGLGDPQLDEALERRVAHSPPAIAVRALEALSDRPIDLTPLLLEQLDRPIISIQRAALRLLVKRRALLSVQHLVARQRELQESRTSLARSLLQADPNLPELYVQAIRQLLEHHKPLLGRDDLLSLPRYRRPVARHSPWGDYLACPSSDPTSALKTGIRKLVGYLGPAERLQALPELQQPGVLSIGLWDEDEKHAERGEIDELYVLPGATYSYDWAVAAVVQQLNDLGLKREVALHIAPAVHLSENSLRLLRALSEAA